MESSRQTSPGWCAFCSEDVPVGALGFLCKSCDYLVCVFCAPSTDEIIMGDILDEADVETLQVKVETMKKDYKGDSSRSTPVHHFAPPKEMLEEQGHRYVGTIRSLKSSFGFIRPDVRLGHCSLHDASGRRDLFFHVSTVPFRQSAQLQVGMHANYWVIPTFRHGSWRFCCESLTIPCLCPSCMADRT